MRVAVALVVATLQGGCATSEPIDPAALASGAGAGAGSDAGGGTSSTSSSSGSGGGGGAANAGGSSGTGGAEIGCGNGVVEPGEECEDQNAVDGDGCDSCAIECAPTETKDATTGHCYAVFPVTGVQATAEASCETWGGAPGLGHLASFVDATENALVAPLVSSNTWIGATDLGGSWEWLDDEVFDFENWQAGEPNFPGVEHCMFMDAMARWHDHDCLDTRPAYLCERRGAGTF